MKKRNSTLVTALILTIILIGCKPNSEQKPDYKAEIIKAEKDFEKMVAEKGLAEGFYQYADSNAIIKREKDTLINGKESIRNYYSNPKFKKASVTWAPDFVSVSEKGDIAYTYGKYNWTVKDSTGKATIHKGIFHTVWKRQTDGSWKYVWD
ncbi:YybH family protein [Flavobacterium pedocola]